MSVYLSASTINPSLDGPILKPDDEEESDADEGGNE